ncbi:MAG: glycine--tRNA ligase [Chitinophagales bacterium]|jgi:glycyl-tRNA synthetase
MQEDLFKRLVAHCKEYGFVYPSSEVYDGLGGVYDYGPLGVELKNNIKSYWWNAMVKVHENIVGLDSAIFMHPLIWKASGHVDAFNDPLVDNKDSKKRFRADVLIETEIDKLRAKADKEVEKAAKRFGESFDEKLYRETNPRVVDYLQRAEAVEKRLAASLQSGDMADIKAIIEELEITEPDTGSKNWTDVRQFNLMFSTQMSNIAGEEGKLYLRPETAQGIFVNFLNVQKTTRQKIPFGIAQIGKAFRNEIVARQFIFRMREFEQMEMQYFVRPGTEMEWYHYWKEKRMAWHKAITPAEKLKFKDHDNLAHYANAAVDIQFEFPFGFKELEGIHSRTDFDLKSHSDLSGKKMTYYDPELEEHYIPYVVETSVGCDRMFLSVLSNALIEETVPDAQGEDAKRTVLKIHPALSPVKCAVLPIVRNKEELVGKAREIYDRLKLHFLCQYDEKDAIGRRYRRQDAIGTPYCVTIDFDTIEDDTVTIRERDSMRQERIPVSEVVRIVRERTDMANLLG